MIDEIRLAYTALRSKYKKPPDGLAVIPIESVSHVLVAIDSDLREHILIRSGDVAPPNDIATIAISHRALLIDGVESVFIDIVCLISGLAEVFEYFAASLIELVQREKSSPADAITVTLKRWRDFMVAPGGQPSRDKLASLFGELLVLKDAVAESVGAGIAYWVGPHGSRHDFRGGTTALEVKTSRSHGIRHVTINGEEQLIPPEGGRLFIHFLRVEQVMGMGQSVSSLIDDILAAGVATEELFEAVTAAGIHVSDLSSISQVTFEVRERLTVPVDGNTPRIVPSSFADGHRPNGVVRIEYVIDLDHCIDSALRPEDYRAVLDAISSGGQE